MMLSKISHIFLSLVMLFTTMGLTIDKHYCGTRLVSVSIFSETESCFDMTSDCCHDDTDTYKLDVDYTLSQLNMDFDQFPEEFPASSFYYLSLYEGSSSISVFSIFIAPRKIQSTLSIFQTYRL